MQCSQLADTNRGAVQGTMNGSQRSGLLRKLDIALLPRQLLTIWFLLEDQKTPWYAKFIAGSAASYVLSPIQIIPNFIPVIGMLDDVLVLAFGIWLIRILTPLKMVQEAQQHAQTALAEGKTIRLSKLRPLAILIGSFWVALSVAGFLFLYRR